MPDDELVVRPVGVAHTPYETPGDAPHQGFADDAEATIEIHPTYADALAGVETYHRLTVLYWAHLVDRDRESPVTDHVAGEDSDASDDSDAGDDSGGGTDHGAFARRGPDRPNPINVCTCTVLGVDDRRIRVSGLDAVDGSPVVDLRPALQVER